MEGERDKKVKKGKGIIWLVGPLSGVDCAEAGLVLFFSCGCLFVCWQHISCVFLVLAAAVWCCILVVWQLFYVALVLCCKGSCCWPVVCSVCI